MICLHDLNIERSKFIFLQCSIFLVMTFYNCKGVSSSNFSYFKSKIHIIDTKVGTLTTPSSLINIDEFSALSQKSTTHMESALTIIVDNSYSRQQKLIAIYVMQYLHKDYYLSFIKKSILAYNENKIEDYLILLILLPEIKQDYQVEENYKDEVKKMVETLRSRSLNVREIVFDTLNN